LRAGCEGECDRGDGVSPDALARTSARTRSASGNSRASKPGRPAESMGFSCVGLPDLGESIARLRARLRRAVQRCESNACRRRDGGSAPGPGIATRNRMDAGGVTPKHKRTLAKPSQNGSPTSDSLTPPPQASEPFERSRAAAHFTSTFTRIQGWIQHSNRCSPFDRLLTCTWLP
jgi:hypothetical protein